MFSRAPSYLVPVLFRLPETFACLSADLYSSVKKTTKSERIHAKTQKRRKMQKCISIDLPSVSIMKIVLLLLIVVWKPKFPTFNTEKQFQPQDTLCTVPGLSSGSRMTLFPFAFEVKSSVPPSSSIFTVQRNVSGPPPPF